MCDPLFPSSQSSCSLAFLCRYDTPLPPYVFVDGKLIDLPPSTPSKNVTFNPCLDTDRHCIVGSRNYGNVEVHMILINLSLPLLGCKSDIELKVQYHGPRSFGCSVTQYERVSTLGESLLKHSCVAHDILLLHALCAASSSSLSSFSSSSSLSSSSLSSFSSSSLLSASLLLLSSLSPSSSPSSSSLASS